MSYLEYKPLTLLFLTSTMCNKQGKGYLAKQHGMLTIDWYTDKDTGKIKRYKITQFYYKCN